MSLKTGAPPKCARLPLDVPSCGLESLRPKAVEHCAAGVVEHHWGQVQPCLARQQNLVELTGPGFAGFFLSRAPANLGHGFCWFPAKPTTTRHSGLVLKRSVVEK